MQSGAWLALTAFTGVYLTQGQLLGLFGDVKMFHDRGYELTTDTAHIDMTAGTAEGHDPVQGQGVFGDITSEGFKLLDHGQTIIFTGKSDMLLRGAAPGTAKHPPAALPAPVVALAARVEAEAKPVLAAAASSAKRQAAGSSATAQADRRHPQPAHRPLPAKPAAGKKA